MLMVKPLFKTKQTVLKNIYVYANTYMHAIVLMRKVTTNVKAVERVMSGFGERKGEGKMM